MDFKSLPGIKNSLGNMNPLEKLAAAVDLPFPALESMLADYASAFAQENRLFTLQIGDGKTYDDRLLPQTVEGEEALSGCYKYIVKGLSPDFFIPLDGLLGQSAQLDILTSTGGLLEAGDGYITRCGLITEARALPSDGGFAQYQLTIEPPLALLRHRRTSRVFQDRTVPQIVQQILKEHIAANPAIAALLKTEFNLTKPYPERSYCLQYRETDLEYVERILAEEGIAYRFEHELGDVPTVKFIAFDDPWSLPQASQGAVRFHRADATEASDSLTEWTQTRRIGPASASLASFDYKPVRTFNANQGSSASEDSIQAEASLEDYDAQGLYYGKDNADLYRYAALRQDVHERQKGGYAAHGNMRGLLAGQWFELQNHPAFEKQPAEEREFVACKLAFVARNNFPQSFTKHLTAAVGVAEGGVPYEVRISARQRGLPLNPAYAHTHHAKPTAPTLQTALVTGPKGETEVYTDELGRIKVQFHWQRPGEHPEFGANLDDRSSCWVRVAYPGAGSAWGHQSLPRVGQEVLIGFIESDIDRPIITGVLHNGEQPNPWFSGLGSLPANRALTGIKTKEFNGQQYNELVFDDTTDQVRTRLSTEYGKTQLNQGYLTHPRHDGQADPRGDGFELRTDRQGALRAGEGLLITTEPQPGATGNQLDRQQALHVLESGRKNAQMLAEAAGKQNADVPETGPEERNEEGQKGQKTKAGHIEHMVEAAKAWENNTNTDLKGEAASNGTAGRQPVLLLSGVGGICLVTPQELVCAAGKNLDTVSQRDTQQSTARRWIHNAGKRISLFVMGIADKYNLKLTTAKGHAKLEAQTGNIEITGDKSLRVRATKKKITATAGTELLVVCGGAYIRLKGGNIEFGCPGSLSFKSAGHRVDGPTSMEVEKKSFGSSKLCGGETSKADQGGGAGIAFG